MPDISKINALAIGSVAKVDGLAKASILDIDGVAVPSAITPILDTYTGATAAYSVRLLKTGQSVSMRIRRSLPTGTPGADDEADIGFVSGVISLDSAISNASAGVTATTFGQFINVGTVGGTTYANPDSLTATALASVDTFYDQSGNGINMEQGTQGQQPYIHLGVSNTDIERTNGLPILRATANDNLTTTGITLTTANTFFFAGTQNLAAADVCAMDGTPLYRTSSGSTSNVTFGFSPTPVYYHDGVLQSTMPTRGDGYTFLTGGDRLLTSVFGARAGTDFLLGAEVSQTMADTHEYLLWLTDQESAGNRTGIESDINTYFSIY